MLYDQIPKLGQVLRTNLWECHARIAASIAPSPHPKFSQESCQDNFMKCDVILVIYDSNRIAGSKISRVRIVFRLLNYPFSYITNL